MLYKFRHGCRAAMAIGTATFVYNSPRSIQAKLSKCDFNFNDTEFNFEAEVKQLRRLKNDSMVPKEQVAANMFSFCELLKLNPIALQEMLQKCKDKEHHLNSDSKAVLDVFKLLDRFGNPDTHACDVLLSSIQYYGSNISLETPYAAKPRHKM